MACRAQVCPGFGGRLGAGPVEGGAADEFVEVAVECVVRAAAARGALADHRRTVGAGGDESGVEVLGVVAIVVRRGEQGFFFQRGIEQRLQRIGGRAGEAGDRHRIGARRRDRLGLQQHVLADAGRSGLQRGTIGRNQS